MRYSMRYLDNESYYPMRLLGIPIGSGCVLHCEESEVFRSQGRLTDTL